MAFIRVRHQRLHPDDTTHHHDDGDGAVALMADLGGLSPEQMAEVVEAQLRAAADDDDDDGETE